MTTEYSMTEHHEQRTGDVAPDPGGYLAASMLIAIVILLAALSLALMISI